VPSRELQLDPFRTPASVDHALAWSCATSTDLATLESPGVRGTIFRYRQVQDEEEPEQPVTGQQPRTGVGVSSAHGEQRGTPPPARAISLAYLYELLYPPLDEAGADLAAFTELYDYQKLGIQFLLERDSALLADDMGLGKTVQCAVALAVLIKQERIRRALVICPKSILRQWQTEAMRWGGLDASLVVGNPQEREFVWKYFSGVILATPHIVLNDSEVIDGEQFDVVVCDDISMLKNPGQITSAIRSVHRIRSWCLNGTPLENKPEDLANVMEFVKPGLFSFQERQRAPGEKEMQRRVSPYFLRRRKEDYLKDLPEKISFPPIVTELEGAQLSAYREAERAEWNALLEAGVKVTKVHIFSVIRALIRLCNVHVPSGTSAKYELLNDELEQVLADSSNKAVVFAHNLDALEFLKAKLSRFNPLLATGQLSDSQRSQVLASFHNSSNLMLASVTAFGKGLNLQHASYVFHFDRTWNPTWERQAEDRCHRRGQNRNVMVYRYLVRHTVEERISQVLAEKNQLFETYINAHSLAPEESERRINEAITLEDLIRIVKPDGE
jgi:SNF2 family DNA or RNA helicase